VAGSVLACTVHPGLALQRSLRRSAGNERRRAHPGPGDAEAYVRRVRAFDRVAVEAPAIEVDTADGYRPPFGDLVVFLAQ
jgi:hypothetical protein